MCGRFSTVLSQSDLAEAYSVDLDLVGTWMPAYTIAPRDKAPLLYARPGADDGAPERRIEIVSWGFDAGWMRPGQPRPINSRIEKLTSGMWRGALNGSRAVVPQTSYFEWYQAADGGKQPILLHADGPLAAAALYGAKREADGTWTHTFSIVTREARDASGEVHERMPAFIPLDSELFQRWISPEKPDDPAELVDELMAESERVAGTVTSYPVSRRVNSVRTAKADDPTLIEPIELDDAREPGEPEQPTLIEPDER